MNQVIQEIAEKLLSGRGSDVLQQSYRDALESHNAPIVVIDNTNVVRYLNKSACTVAQIDSAEEVIGKPVTETGFAWHAEGRSPFERLARNEHTTYFELNGDSYACEATSIVNRLNEAVGVVEYIHTEGDWIYNVDLNQLTGIPNKRRFLLDTRRLLDCNPHEKYSIVYWNIIRFKLINDVFSVATGDRVLKSIAATISSFADNVGTCGHLGDDRFAFCVPRDHISADWFKRHSEVTLMSDTAMYTFNSSYGVYEIYDRSCSVETMCDRAALAQASVNDVNAIKGDCVAYYDDEMHERLMEDQGLISELSYALASNQIKAYYQPIYDMNTGHVASAEALARWEHPEKGLIPPGRFIPLFERNGMITELDKHLWNQVGAFQESRLAAGKPVVPISVNVSRVDFFATTLLEELDEIVASHNLPHKLLRVEVTESAYTDDPMRIREVVTNMREHGFTVLLDDFGSGYSSLNTVKDIPIDILKLDMSFLRDFDTDERAKYVIYHIVAMAHDLGLKVVAEGVETKDQVVFLREVNCHLAQGFFYARPQPEADFVEVLEKAVPQGL